MVSFRELYLHIIFTGTSLISCSILIGMLYPVKHALAVLFSYYIAAVMALLVILEVLAISTLAKGNHFGFSGWRAYLSVAVMLLLTITSLSIAYWLRLQKKDDNGDTAK